MKNFISIWRRELTHKGLEVDAFVFLPRKEEEIKPYFAMFTHGYTSHKGDLLNWGSRLAESNIPSVIFDLPGHFLGSFREFDDYETFVREAHCLFSSAFTHLEQIVLKEFPLEEHKICHEKLNLIFGGHSLGGLLALKAMELQEFSLFQKIGIGVGLGLGLSSKTHLFESDFYEKTLNVRRQLVADSISPQKIFPWIQKEKLNLKLDNQRVHLITGEDDLVVTQNGAKYFQEHLLNQGNDVTLNLVRRLPHHRPELASGFIMDFVKKL